MFGRPDVCSGLLLVARCKAACFLTGLFLKNFGPFGNVVDGEGNPQA